MTFKTAATVALLLALVSLGVYWFVTRPTPQERVLLDFFLEFRRSHYDEAEKLTTSDDFYTMAASTSVRDSDGSVYLIGDYFPKTMEGILRHSIEQYVKPHVTRWKYLYLNTEVTDENNAVVKFRIEIGIRDYKSGGIMGVVHDGRIEGTAYMLLENDEWVVSKFDLHIFSDEDLTLAPYLEQAH